MNNNQNLPYRLGIGLVIIRSDKKIFTGRRLDSTSAWQMPQGGIDKNEVPIETAYREMFEETGIAKDKVSLVATTKRWYKYDFPNGIYFLNLGKINKDELSNFLKCDKSIFDNLIYDPYKRTNYNDLKSKYPLSNIMYTNIDNYMHNLCIHKNLNSVEFNS